MVDATTWSEKRAKIQILEFEKETQDVTRLKFIDNMSKNEMDQVSVVEDTEQTRFYPQTDGHLREKHKRIAMRIDGNSSAYSESFKRVECTNWEYRRVRATHQLPVPQTHWFAVSVW